MFVRTIPQDTFKPHLKNWLSQDSVIVTIISTVVICLTIIQMFLSTKAFRYFELRDEIYTIPTFKVDRIRPEFGHVIHHGHIYI
uniref:DUF2254 domain-containing protein n=1 Tax=Rhabditophanes sp. KR3021 TaxID=114890 RepID=A0AC35TL27_9BILA